MEFSTRDVAAGSGGISDESGADDEQGPVDPEAEFLDLWAFAISNQGLGLTGQQFWHMTPCEYYALRRVSEAAIDRQMEAIAGIRCDIHNAWMRGEHMPAKRPSDFYKPILKRKGEKARVLADPMDPLGTQTVEEKKEAIRSMLWNGAQSMIDLKQRQGEKLSEEEVAKMERLAAKMEGRPN